ncbi:hypothetical protein KY290_001970 [Solanum tuberosum]|uniref:Bifunctional inhibitor/plant lipid transfer protein/seed storage helical domain-containing protein n=1 Tax=Solanum tuberosum TaxID=4113 RepID=A0ABQ7WQW6_SOLTU|nr:hypothetical protein KY290_001970 [Solanum tuberosum]
MMTSRTLVMLILVITYSIAVKGSNGHPCSSTFFSALIQLIPCRASVVPFSSVPPSEACCASIKALGQPCLCVLINGPPISGVDRSMAVQLPDKCTANFEQCGDCAVFTLKNNCNVTIWPGSLSGAGHPFLINGGLELQPYETTEINAPTGWSGRFWARTHCQFDTSGKGTCATADCGGVLQCNGAGGTPPASLAEFTLDSPMDFYDVSFVDGFNIPISVYPSGGSGNCSNIQCSSDINLQCPQELQVKTYDGTAVACKSACFAFNKPEYCCTGEFNNPSTWG